LVALSIIGWRYGLRMLSSSVETLFLPTNKTLSKQAAKTRFIKRIKTDRNYLCREVVHEGNYSRHMPLNATEAELMFVHEMRCPECHRV
jgi:hypothetical protein